MSAVTLSTMVSNEITVPLLMKMGGLVRQNARLPQRLLNPLGRTTIAAIIAGAYLFSRITGDAHFPRVNWSALVCGSGTVLPCPHRRSLLETGQLFGARNCWHGSRIR
ncbi:MAG: hypothetical protein IPM37_03420, partial [Hahellaceae bacterium]|nr:hypothetical protein [Hahellaceae bacterium]